MDGKVNSREILFYIMYRYIEVDVYWFRCHNFLKRSTKDTNKTRERERVGKKKNQSKQIFYIIAVSLYKNYEGQPEKETVAFCVFSFCTA